MADTRFDLRRTYAVTGHSGAAAWIRARVPDAKIVEHIDPELVRPGDTVIGTLPVHLAAAVIARGARFLHLSIDVPPQTRHRDLTPEEMDRYGAHLAPYEVWPARVITGWMLPSIRGLWRRLSAYSWRGHAIILTVLLGLVAPNLLSQALWESRLIWSAVLAVATAGIVYALYAWRHSVLSSRIVRVASVPPRPILVMGLSPLARDADKRPAALDVLAWAEKLPIDTLALTNSEIAARRNALQTAGRAEDKQLLETYATLEQHAEAQRFRWQQNLRAIKAQLPELRAIIVLTSPQSQADFPIFERFLRAVLRAAGHEPHIKPLFEKVADFENYEQLNAAFAAARRIARDWGAKPHDLCIDVTAGQKIFSIAAAIATLNSGTVFTYVNNDGSVSAFDATIELAEE